MHTHLSNRTKIDTRPIIAFIFLSSCTVVKLISLVFKYTSLLVLICIQ